KEEKNENCEHEGRVLYLTINDERYKWHQEYITGAEIRKLGDIPREDKLFLAIKKPWEDEPIPNDKKVNLARPEIEHFYSKDKDDDDEITLIVNGRLKPWEEYSITFKQVVVLAFGDYDSNPNKVYT